MLIIFLYCCEDEIRHSISEYCDCSQKTRTVVHVIPHNCMHCFKCCWLVIDLSQQWLRDILLLLVLVLYSGIQITFIFNFQMWNSTVKVGKQATGNCPYKKKGEVWLKFNLHLKSNNDSKGSTEINTYFTLPDLCFQKAIIPLRV